MKTILLLATVCAAAVMITTSGCSTCQKGSCCKPAASACTGACCKDPATCAKCCTNAAGCAACCKK